MAHDAPDSDFPSLIADIHASVHTALELLYANDLAGVKTCLKGMADQLGDALNEIDELED